MIGNWRLWRRSHRFVGRPLLRPDACRVAASARPGDDAGSLPLAFLLTMVGFAATALIAPMVISEITTTRANVRRVDAYNAAQAGLNVALGHIRSAVDGAGNGVPANLPCGEIGGAVSDSAGIWYRVRLAYYTDDPTGQPDAWLGLNSLACAAGSGPASVPAFAMLRAEGSTQLADPFVAEATVRATYPFLTSWQSTVGGLIHGYDPAGELDLCLDAGPGSPTAGTNIGLQGCRTGLSQQRFAYTANLTIVLVSSRTAFSLGMCLDAGTPHAAGRLLQIQPCTQTTQPRQQWIFSAAGSFQGTTNGTTPDGYCFNAQTPGAAGSSITLGTGPDCGAGFDSTQTFRPDAQVATGAAGALTADGTGQLVNLEQFSRCLEVMPEGTDYLIAGACAQATDPASIGWTQNWSWPAIVSGSVSATGRIIASAPTGPPDGYCLRSPGTTTVGQYVQVTDCPAGLPPVELTWTVYSNTGTFATSYQIVDDWGNCLTPTDPSVALPDLHSAAQQISKLVVAECDGSIGQKWSAPASILQSLPLEAIGER